jgi:hyperosmotically inducible periplasmic protein
MTKSKRTFVLLCAAGLLGLAGCANTGAGNFLNDVDVSARVKSAFLAEPSLKSMMMDISVSTEAGVVTLSGAVKNRGLRAKAVSVARSVDGVKRVNDQLTVQR